MKKIMLLLLLCYIPSVNAATCPDFLNVEKKRLASDEIVNLCDEYKGKVLLIVNTASKCGYTYQYDGLETLYSRYKDRGLVVVGFPSNDFANQEPGNEEQIQAFCRLTYGVKFPMFAKTTVARGTHDPVYKGLARITGEYPQWNFHKYLVDRKGNVVSTHNSKSEPLGDAIVGGREKLW